MLRTFAYVRATSLDQALQQLNRSGVHVHAGGTDLLGCLRDGVTSPETVVSLATLEELRGISDTNDGGLRIGAMTTLADVAAHPGMQQRYAALSQAAAVVGSPQLRNQGTLGGNLCQRPRCWYFRGEYDCLRKGGAMCYAMEGQNQYHAILGGHGCYVVHPSDTAPALLALDARVRVAHARGSRVVPIDTFFVRPDQEVTTETVLAPGEIVTELLLPPASGQSSYRKVRARGSWDFALAGIAISVTAKAGIVTNARVVLSGVAPVPWRVPAVEKVLVGHKLERKVIDKALEAAVADAEPLAQNAYKVPLVRGIVDEALTAMMT